MCDKMPRQRRNFRLLLLVLLLKTHMCMYRWAQRTKCRASGEFFLDFTRSIKKISVYFLGIVRVHTRSRRYAHACAMHIRPCIIA